MSRAAWARAVLLTVSLGVMPAACATSGPPGADPSTSVTTTVDTSAASSSPSQDTVLPTSTEVIAPRTGRITFVSSRDGLAPSIFVMDADGGNVTRLTSAEPGQGDSNPTWSPDGSLIAYQSERADQSVLMVVRPDGTGSRMLTEAADGGASDPSWSPDGSRLLFSSGRSGQPGVWTIAADGSSVALLVDDAAFPAWSPDGSKVAFTSFRDGKPAIYTISADGTDLARITEPDGSGDFDWSPDGTRIVFTCVRDGSQDICVVNADGTGLEQLTDARDLEFNPEWSPDGTTIAYRRSDAGNALHMMDADGTDQRGVAQAFFEQWSPDGTWLVVSIDDQIYTMNADGSGLVQLTDNEHGASWPQLR